MTTSTDHRQSESKKGSNFEFLKKSFKLKNQFKDNFNVIEFVKAIEEAKATQFFISETELHETRIFLSDNKANSTLKDEINQGEIKTQKYKDLIELWVTRLVTSKKTNINELDEEKDAAQSLNFKKYFNDDNSAKDLSHELYKAYLFYEFAHAYYFYYRDIDLNYESRLTCDLTRSEGAPISALAPAIICHIPPPGTEHSLPHPTQNSLVDDFKMFFSTHTDNQKLNDRDKDERDKTESFIVQAATASGAFAGLLLGYALHKFCKWLNLYPSRQPLDPLHRTTKTFAAVAQNLGLGISMMLLPGDLHKIPAAILSSLFAFGGVFIAVIGNLFFPKIFNNFVEKLETYCHVNHEGLSKYGKTALVWGTCPGILAGLILHTYGISFSFWNFGALKIGSAIALGGVFGGVSIFVLVMIAVPIVNWIRKNKHRQDQRPESDDFRNNYARAGISIAAAFSAILVTLGAIAFPLYGLTLPYVAMAGVFVGAVISILPKLNNQRIYNIKLIIGCALAGALLTLIGAFFLSNIFITAGAIVTIGIGSAIGGTLGGPFFTLLGPKISKYLETYFDVKTKDSDNNWDFTVRSFINLFGSLGICAGFVIAISSGAMAAGATVGASLVGAAFLWPTVLNFLFQGIGAIVGLNLSPEISKENQKSEMTMTQRISVGLGQGNTIGGIGGLVFGFMIAGPWGAVVGFGFGNSFLGFVVGVARGIPQKYYDDLKLRWSGLLIQIGIRSNDDVRTHDKVNNMQGTNARLAPILGQNKPPETTPTSPDEVKKTSNHSPTLQPLPKNQPIEMQSLPQQQILSNGNAPR